MKKALLVVSFGTSYEQTRKLTIEAIEQDLQAAFPDRAFYRAWTSGMILKKLRETRGMHIDTVQEAMERMLADGVTDVLIQPTHMLNGFEYEKARRAIAAFAGRFEQLTLGAPLIDNWDDLYRLASALEQIFAQVQHDQMLVLMGHGSEHAAFPPYGALEQRFREDGFERFAVGTVEFDPGFDGVLKQARAHRPKKIFLAPLLVVAGDHALNDMAGDEEGSWKRQLEREGFEVECLLRGLGEYPQIRELYAEHARQALPFAAAAV